MEDWAIAERPQKINESLLTDKKHTFFTPHLGSAIDETRRDIALEAAKNIIQVLSGEMPQGAVNNI